MAVIRNVSEDASNLPAFASLGALLCLVVALLGIKLKWFRHRLTFESLPTGPVRRDVRENTAKLTGVYRARNLDEEDVYRPISLPPIKIKQTEDMFSSYNNPNAATSSQNIPNAMVAVLNEKSPKSIAISSISTTASPKPTSTKATKDAKKPKSGTKDKVETDITAKSKSERVSTPVKRSPVADSQNKTLTSAQSSIELRGNGQDPIDNAEVKQKSPKLTKNSPSPKDKKKYKLDKNAGKLDKTKSSTVTNLSKSEPALNKFSKEAKPETPKKGFWNDLFSSNKDVKKEHKNVVGKNSNKVPKSPISKAAKKLEKKAKEDKKIPKLEKSVISSPIELVNEVAPLPQPRNTPPQDQPQAQPRVTQTTKAKSSNRKLLFTDSDDDTSHGFLKNDQKKEKSDKMPSPPPQSPDDGFDAWDMVNEHRKSITLTAAQAQIKPPNAPNKMQAMENSQKIKDNATGLLTKPKTMREMKKLSKENAEVKLRKSTEVIDTEA